MCEIVQYFKAKQEREFELPFIPIGKQDRAKLNKNIRISRVQTKMRDIFNPAKPECKS